MSTWIDPQNRKVNYLWQLCQLISYLYVPNQGPLSSPLVTKDLSIRSRPKIVCQGIPASQRGVYLFETLLTIQWQRSWHETEEELPPFSVRPQQPRAPSQLHPPVPQPSTPTLSSSSCLYLPALFIPHFPKWQQPHLCISVDRPHQTPETCLSEPIRWPSLRMAHPGKPNRPVLTDGLMVVVGAPVVTTSLWQSCLSLMAIFAVRFPRKEMLPYKIAAGCGWESRAGARVGKSCLEFWCWFLIRGATVPRKQLQPGQDNQASLDFPSSCPQPPEALHRRKGAGRKFSNHSSIYSTCVHLTHSPSWSPCA